eukprot:7514909-Prorocentrum_lima.AAC.1
MTSSLVGSEMCIRDSAWVGDRVFAHGALLKSRDKLGIMAPLFNVHTHFAVSYTHLTLPTICSV